MHAPCRLAIASVFGVSFVCGCGPSRPARIVPPTIDPTAVVAGILQADANGDGRLDAGELPKAPAFISIVADLDGDADKALSRGELQAWLDGMQSSQVAITAVAVAVKHKGRPLAGATVSFVPESYMGAAVAAAGGTTDAAGHAQLTVAGSPYPGVHSGVYRVEVTGKGNDGKPLAAKYNTSTTLGAAVGGMVPKGGVLTFSLE